MKKLFKKNRIIMASLTIMLLIAGYLNFTADRSEPVQHDEMEEIAAFPEEPDQATVGEAVMTSTQTASVFSASVRLKREQIRSKNQDSLMAIINNEQISAEMKAGVIADIQEMAKWSEMELAAETLLEAQGFPDTVVSIDDEKVDVVIGKNTVSDAERAQIEDIVARKTKREISELTITTFQ